MGIQDANPGVSPRAEAVDGGYKSSLIRHPDKGARVGVFLEPEGDVLSVRGIGPEDRDVLQRPAGKRLVHVIPNGLNLECGCGDKAVKVPVPVLVAAGTGATASAVGALVVTV